MKQKHKKPKKKMTLLEVNTKMGMGLFKTIIHLYNNECANIANGYIINQYEKNGSLKNYNEAEVISTITQEMEVYKEIVLNCIAKSYSKKDKIFVEEMTNILSQAFEEQLKYNKKIYGSKKLGNSLRRITPCRSN